MSQETTALPLSLPLHRRHRVSELLPSRAEHQCVCTQDPAPKSNIDSSGLSILLLIQMFVLTNCIYPVARFSESSKNCKLWDMFFLYTDLPMAITIAGDTGTHLESKKHEEWYNPLMQVPKENDCKKICIITFDVFLSPTTLEV